MYIYSASRLRLATQFDYGPASALWLKSWDSVHAHTSMPWSNLHAHACSMYTKGHEIVIPRSRPALSSTRHGDHGGNCWARLEYTRKIVTLHRWRQDLRNDKWHPQRRSVIRGLLGVCVHSVHQKASLRRSSARCSCSSKCVRGMLSMQAILALLIVRTSAANNGCTALYCACAYRYRTQYLYFDLHFLLGSKFE